MNTLLLIAILFVAFKAVQGKFLVLLVRLGYKFTPSGCINGKVQRLDDGRVNVCSDQEWKTVCEKNYQWSVYQANIACRLLGYNNNGTFFSIMTVCFASLWVPQGQV